ncbi:MAG: hypothetical protein JXR40_03350 [Pontiellaceae bacterium]|nr:hypothetical protein [Pontiellaceae bacterium]
MNASIKAHMKNAPSIIAAIHDGREMSSFNTPVTPYLRLSGLKEYQRYLYRRFARIIEKPSFDYISKTEKEWMIVGDHRREIEAEILLIIERHGVGIGMLVLHAQQINARHILTRIASGRHSKNLAVPTGYLPGENGKLFLSIPIRQFRADLERLATLNIAKPKPLWHPDRIVTHERDQNPCFYCSCPEINPSEVVVGLKGSRHGLSRNYSLGFTFAPFGNPLSVVHFLAWDRASSPLNMNRTPVTVSDLVKLTREINLSIRNFFAETDIQDYPVIDGISNGWAGNTIYHQHFQFFQPEHPVPIARARTIHRPAIINRDDVTVARVKWPSPAYRIQASNALNTGLLGNDLAGIWRLMGGSRKVPYKTFRDGYTPNKGDKVHAHTQNLYVPGHDLGDSAYFIPRDRERVDYRPSPDEFINLEYRFRARHKNNLGALETTGTIIMDDKAQFKEMQRWQPADVSEQIRRMIASIAPQKQKVSEFETAARELFPA